VCQPVGIASAALIGGKVAVWTEVGAGADVELRAAAPIVDATTQRRSWLSRLFASVAIALIAACAAASAFAQFALPPGHAATPSHATIPSNHPSPDNVRFTHLTVADGLSHSDVRAIVQDQQGFMWFGTWHGGLNRYDGYTFKVYRHDEQDDGSLGSDTIWALYVDRTGVLWVGTNAGADRYDREKDSFVHYRHRDGDPDTLPGSPASWFMEDEAGTLWVSGGGGLSRFDRNRDRFVPFRPNPKVPVSAADSDVRIVTLDRTTGLLWHGTWNAGVHVVNRSTGAGGFYANDPNDASSLSSNELADIFQDRHGDLWVGTFRGLNRFDRKTQTFRRYLHDARDSATLSDDYVTAITEDRAGRFWVATNNGLNVMDRDLGTFTRYLHDPDDPSSLSGTTINPRALYVDKSGALWMGMRSSGVDRLPGAPERFSTYRRTSPGAKRLSNNVVSGLAMGSGGVLWIGTEAGVDRFDGRTFTHHPANADDPTTLVPGPERVVAEDAVGAVWTGTHGGGLDRIDKRGVTHFRHVPGNGDTPANNNISSLLADPRGGVWIGVFGKGLDYFDGEHFTHFSPDPKDSNAIPDGYVRPMWIDRQGVLWMASVHSGVVRLDTRTRKFTPYLLVPNQAGNPDANETEDVYFDGTHLWVGSPKGLFALDPATGKLSHHYTEKDGLPSSSVVGVVGDAQGYLWVSTTNGLSRFAPKTQTFRNYDQFDGLQSNVFSGHCRARAPDGRLFFGGVNGLTAFYPDKLADNRTPPPVVLTGFDLFNKPVTLGDADSPLRTAIHVASAIGLRHDQSVIRFQFAALNYDSPQKNRYAYKLEGFDHDWQQTDAAQRSATYTNLDPGHYTFRVKASNNDGVWNDEGVAVHLTVRPPWWNTNLFRALWATIFLGLLWAAWEFRVRQLHREFEVTVVARVAERTRIARDLHDTLLQSFQALLLRFQTASLLLPDRPTEAKQKLDIAIDYAAKAITEGRDAIHELRVATLEDNDLALALNTLGGDLAAVAGARAPALHVGVVGQPRELRAIVRNEVYKVAAEALRNAFQHGAAARVEVEIRYDRHEFRVRVRDDGKGIERGILAGPGIEGHYGLRGMPERAALIGGQVAVRSEVGAGTEVELRVPGKTVYAKTQKRRRFSRLFARNASAHREGDPSGAGRPIVSDPRRR
jgi:signal transduction histidine kinase/ligand-binding sensor domain-containing protein